MSAATTDNCHRYVPTLPAQPVHVEETAGSCFLHSEHLQPVPHKVSIQGAGPVSRSRLVAHLRAQSDMDAKAELHHQHGNQPPKTRLRLRHLAPWKVYPDI